ncbi:MAG: alginate export family protein, partial [Bacteroidota bacterium]
AWVDLRVGENGRLKIGRQPWNYDDMRVLSSRNWWASGMSYDGILYQIEDEAKDWRVHLGVSYNNEGTKNGIIDDSAWNGEKIKSMNFLNIRHRLSKDFSASVLFSLSAREDVTNDQLKGTGTHGLNLFFNEGKNSSGGVFGHLSGYYQHGTDLMRGSDGDYKSISAGLIAANIGYRSADKKLEISAGMEWITGHDYSNTDADYMNTRHSFDLLYSGRFPYYGGFMNHFLIQDSYQKGTKGGGYFDPWLRLTYRASKATSLNASVFFPSLTTKVTAHTSIDEETGKPAGIETDANGNPVFWKGSLGRYLDMGITHKINKDIILKSGLSFGFPSDIKNQMVYGYKDVASKELYDLGVNYFGWVMLVVKPTFLE